MSMNASDQITIHAREIRGGLIALGAPLIVIGAWALFAPHAFYDNFPTSASHWVAGLGPYDEHLVRDVGSLLMAIGVLQVWAAARLSLLLVRVALVVGLVYGIPHLIFHASETGSMSTGDNVVNITMLALAVIAALVLLALTRASGAAAASADTTHDGPIETREVTYGTH
jgi:hypothetical protein